MLGALNFRRPVYKLDLAELPDLPVDSHHLPSGYRSRLQPDYYADAPQKNRLGMRIYAQPDVYTEARKIALKSGSTKVIDVGCGDGVKLAGFHPDFEIYGLDYGPNLDVARSRHPFGSWIDHDLSKAGPLPVDTIGAVIICADVIEHLVEPDLLVDKLREALHEANAVILSTPDRERFRGLAHLGPPVNPAHTREWSLAEFGRYLGSRGCDQGSVGHTRYRTWRAERKNIIAVLR